MPFWTPQREWQGQDAYLIGGGASLSQFDFTRLKGLNVIGCNDAFRLGPEIVKVCVFGDGSWFKKNFTELEKYHLPIITNSPILMEDETPWLLKIPRLKMGLSDNGELGWNYSTGAAAINLALLFGATRIYLLGFDLSKQPKNNVLTTHWHEHRNRFTTEESFKRFLRGFEAVFVALKQPHYEGVKVINVVDASFTSSNLPFFPKQAFHEVFK